MASLLLVEDDPTIAETLRYTLERAGHDVVVAGDGMSALRQFGLVEFQLVLLDLMLPGIDGFEVCARVRRQRPDVAIVVVTALEDEGSLLKAFDAGADDYVTKPFKTSELLARIKANLRRAETTAPETIKAGDILIDDRAHTVTVADELVALRPKEYDLLRLLASNPGSLLTRQRIAAEVWGYDSMLSSRTIDTHILNIRKKIESPSAFSYIETAHGLGYRFDARPKER